MRRVWIIVWVALCGLVALAGCLPELNSAPSAPSAPSRTSVCGLSSTLCPDNLCVDLTSVREHCGACGHRCAPAETCVMGVCGCNGHDVMSDRDNCGACGRRCGNGEACVAGNCECPGRDFMNDPANCGGCGINCGTSSACVAGLCRCPDGRTLLCGDTCRDVLNDETSCGSCDRQCAEGESCRGGACMCLRDDLMTNPAHCGACGRRCRTGEGCVGGMCACPGVRGAFCSDTCRDIAVDTQNCGACGNVCPTGAMTCADGRCVCPGAMGIVCGGACVEAASSVVHCGACDHACMAGTACVAGHCMPRSIAPPSGAIVATARPTFRWGESTLTLTRVQVCADRACARVVATIGGSVRNATPTTALAPGVYFWRVGDVASGAYGTVWEFAVGRRPASVGTFVGSLSDLDGDALGDLLVGAPQGRAASLHRGRRATTPAMGVRVEDAMRDGFGFRLARVGDINGDGSLDFAVGGYGGGSTDVSSIYGVNATAMISIHSGFAPPAARTSSAGDVNADGYGDLILGDPVASSITLLRGSAGANFDTPLYVRREPGAGFGAALAAAWDVEGDGFADVVVGAPDSAGGRGAAYVYHGGEMGLGAPTTLLRPADVTGFGEEVAGLGDVNGDGYADVLVGARGTRAFVFMGGAMPSVTAVVLGGAAGSETRAVAAGDVDGDGYADVLIPRPGAGRAELYRGGVSGLAMTPVVLVDAGWSEATGAVVGAGDLDGDGCAEVAVGVGARGVVRVFSGDPTRPLARSVVVSGVAREEFGATLAM